MDSQDEPPQPPTSPLEDMAELLDSMRSSGSRGGLTDSDELQEYCKQVGGRLDLGPSRFIINDGVTSHTLAHVAASYHFKAFVHLIHSRQGSSSRSIAPRRRGLYQRSLMVKLTKSKK